MNRLGMGLAVGAGYVLGRTKKMKLAFAVGTMVAGKRMNLSPRALADLVSQQLQNNPQFKEIGDQLRQDVRGVGKAATGALVERQISGLADRLHGRTNQVKDQLAGVVPDAPRVGGKRRRDEEPDDDHDERDDHDDHDDHDERDGRDGDERYDDAPRDEDEEAPRPRKRAPARKASARKAADERGSDDGAPAKKTARTAKKAPARKAAAAKTATRRTSRARTTRGGGDDD